MKIFTKLYEKALIWSRHPKAAWFLCAVSFTESSFFPIPPDVMLLPMSIANRAKAWWYAFITTISSVAGAVAGYAIGYFAISLVMPYINDFGMADEYASVEAWFQDDTGWIMVFTAGFTLIPYKIITIASGAAASGGGGISLPLFIAVSLAARGARYAVVAGAGYWGGPFIEKHFMKYFDLLGFMMIVLLVVGWLIYQYA